MKLTTKYGGEIEYTKEDIISFDDGLYGFPKSLYYISIGEMTKEFPFKRLQSLDEENVSFIITNPFLFVENYEFDLDDSVISLIGADHDMGFEIFVTVSIPSELSETSINLKSPLVIGKYTKKAQQVILNEDFPLKHKIFKKE